MYGQEINISMVYEEKQSKELFLSNDDTQYVFPYKFYSVLNLKRFNFQLIVVWFFFFLQETNLLLQQVEGVKPSVPITAGIEFSLRHPMFRKRISTVPITNFPDYTLTPRPIVK